MTSSRPPVRRTFAPFGVVLLVGAMIALFLVLAGRAGTASASTGHLVASGAGRAAAPPDYPMYWDREYTPRDLDFTDGHSDALACPTATFCVDAAYRDLYVLNGGHWQRSRQLKAGVADVSCASPTFCAAVDDYQGMYLWNGSTWTNVTDEQFGNLGLRQVSCPAANECYVLDDGGLMWHLDGTTWTEMVRPSGKRTQSLSCVSTTYCMAVWSNQYSIWNGTAWSTGKVYAGPSPAPSDGLTLVSCGSTTRCVAATSATASTFGLTMWNGTHWSPLTSPFKKTSSIHDAYCSATGCAAVSVKQALSTWTGSKWRPPADVESHDETANASIAGPVACVTASSCIALDTIGQQSNWNGSRWSVMKPVLPASGYLQSISCVSDVLCAVGDGHGNARIFDADGLERPFPVDRTSETTTTASCASASRCVVAPGTGASAAWNGTKWTELKGPGLSTESVSCIDSGDCYAVGKRFERLHGSTWHVVGKPPLDRPVKGAVPVRSISCASATFCVAVSTEGRAVFNGHTWRRSLPFKHGKTDPTVSCAAPRRCTAISPTGQLVSLAGTHWTTIGKATSKNSTASISCVNPKWCVTLSYTGGSTAVVGGKASESRRVSEGYGHSGFEDISCWSVNHCRMVGFDFTQRSRPAA